MKEFYITVLFGSDQVRKFHNKEIFSEEEIKQFAKTFLFQTRIELEAFILGIEAANGWLDLIYFEGVSVNQKKTATIDNK
jgi:hypothetical protein